MPAPLSARCNNKSGLVECRLEPMDLAFAAAYDASAVVVPCCLCPASAYAAAVDASVAVAFAAAAAWLVVEHTAVARQPSAAVTSQRLDIAAIAPYNLAMLAH